MRAILGLPSADITEQTRIMFLEWEDQIQGMLVDGVNEIIHVRTSEIKTTTVIEKENKIFQGTCQIKDKLYILLSVRELMRNDENIE